MAYVDHAFSISDEDFMMESSHVIQNRPPIKEIALAVSLLVFGTLAMIFGIVMAVNRIGGDRAHGVFFAILGSLLFLPGFYYTRIAYYAYKGYKGFSFANIPPVLGHFPLSFMLCKEVEAHHKYMKHNVKDIFDFFWFLEQLLPT